MSHKIYRKLQNYADRWWYAPILGLLALLDFAVVVIPTDGLLVSGVLLAPRRWIWTSLWISIGSTLGAVCLAYVVHDHGLPLLLQIQPGINESVAWQYTESFMNRHGAWALWLVAASPFVQHPAVALAALAHMSLWKIFWIMISGRTLKFLIVGWIASHAPKHLEKLWGIQGDLEETKDLHPKKPAK